MHICRKVETLPFYSHNIIIIILIILSASNGPKPMKTSTVAVNTRGGMLPQTTLSSMSTTKINNKTGITPNTSKKNISKINIIVLFKFKTVFLLITMIRLTSTNFEITEQALTDHHRNIMQLLFS